MGEFPPYLTGIFAVLLLSAFVKIFTSLNILRIGLGLQGAGFGAVVFAVSFALSSMLLPPQVRSAAGFTGSLFDTEALRKIDLEKSFRPFLEKNTKEEIVEKLSTVQSKYRGEEPLKDAPKDFSVVVASFLLSQLAEAFRIGFMVLIPFLVIDLLVVNVLMTLGITQMSQSVVAIPLKLLLFFAVDGWTLIAEKLLGGYVA